MNSSHWAVNRDEYLDIVEPAWGDLPKTYPEFADTLRQEIKEMESKWPV